jgi:hypothetical protein
MKDKYIMITAILFFINWWGSLIYFSNGTNPHPGTWQFLLGTVLTAGTIFGAVALFSDK